MNVLNRTDTKHQHLEQTQSRRDEKREKLSIVFEKNEEKMQLTYRSCVS